jgi:VanZ family protein
MALIFFVSSLPTAPLPPGVSDKSGHLIAYLVLVVLAVRACAGGLPPRVTRGVAIGALMIAMGYGAFDEIHQWFVPGRSAELADWFADSAGAGIGLAVCWAWGIIRFRSDV